MLAKLRRTLGPWLLVLALSGCSGAFGRAMERGDQAAAAGRWDAAAQAFFKSELAKYARLVKKAGIEAQ